MRGIQKYQRVRLKEGQVLLRKEMHCVLPTTHPRPRESIVCCPNALHIVISDQNQGGYSDDRDKLFGK